MTDPARQLLGGTRTFGVVAGALLSLGCSLLIDTGNMTGPNATSNEAGGASDTAPEAVMTDAAPDVDAAPDPHLLGAWDFDEEGGSVTRDASGRNHAGRIEGTATLGGGGHKGGALLLQGNGGMIVDALAGDAYPTTGTLTFWVYPELAQDNPGMRNVFDGWDTSRVHMFIRTGKQWHLGFMGPGDTYAFFQYFAAPTAAEWTHIVLTWNDASKSAALYVSGRPTLAGTYGQPFSPSGQRVAFGYGFIGRIDEARLYDRAMDALEVAALE